MRRDRQPTQLIGVGQQYQVALVRKQRVRVRVRRYDNRICEIGLAECSMMWRGERNIASSHFKQFTGTFAAAKFAPDLGTPVSDRQHATKAIHPQTPTGSLI